MSQSDRRSLSESRIELEDLRTRLREAEQTLDAIRTGQVDALVVYTEHGECVYTLQGAEQPYRIFVEQMPQGVATLSKEGVVLYANRSMSGLCGVPLSSLIGSELAVNVSEGSRGSYADLLLRAEGGHSVEREIELGHGDAAVPVLLALTLLGDEHEAHVAVTATDLSEQKQYEKDIAEHNLAIQRLNAEAALRESEERFQSVANAAPIIMWVISPEGKITFVNQHYCDFFGVAFEEALGNTWGSTLHPDDYRAFATAFHRSISEGAPFEALGRVRRADREWRYIHAKGLPRYSPEGDLIGIVGCSPDVTDLMEFQSKLEKEVAARTAELESANNELRGFAYAISHDLRAPLRAIISSSRILINEIGDSIARDHRALLERQAYNAAKLAILIDDLLSLSRVSRQELRWQNLDMSAIACEVVAMMPNLSERCTFDIQEGMTGLGDESLVKLIYQNLLENACKFSPEGGTVQAGAFSQDHKTVYFVRDHGIGFDMAYVHKLFVPFERLHSEREFPGTGIGLANVQRVVKRHGGKVWAEGLPGKGATFYFTLNSSTP